MESKKIIENLENKMSCNCDLDNWEPDKRTGHSWVCRIHQEYLRKVKGGEKWLRSIVISVRGKHKKIAH